MTLSLNTDLQKLYDLCIPNDLCNHNLLIIIALEMDGYLSYLLRHNLIKTKIAMTQLIGKSVGCVLCLYGYVCMNLFLIVSKTYRFL